MAAAKFFTIQNTRRTLILIAVLIIMIGSLVYDRYVARPGSQRGYQVVLELVGENAEKTAEEPPITSETVQQVLGRTPSRAPRTDDYTIETYSWRRGTLVRTYDVNVVYKPNEKGQLVLYAPYLNTEPPATALPGYSVPEGELQSASAIHQNDAP